MGITADTHRCLEAEQCVLPDPDRCDQSEEGAVLVPRERPALAVRPRNGRTAAASRMTRRFPHR